jgi:uncharacterized protein YbjT (DUF2867 family)
MAPDAGIRAAVAGATGLVGSRVLGLLLADPAVARVTAPTRRPLAPHPKLDNPILPPGNAWPALPALEEAYACLGTTRAKAGSAEAFRAVDLDLTVSFARAAKAAGARRFGLVSAVGADARSRFLYPRVKGEAEAAVAGLGFESAVIARPSFLLGARAESRPAEKLLIPVFLLLGPALGGSWAKYRAVDAGAVAASLIAATRGRVPGVLALESDALAGDGVE